MQHLKFNLTNMNTPYLLQSHAVYPSCGNFSHTCTSINKPYQVQEYLPFKHITAIRSVAWRKQSLIHYSYQNDFQTALDRCNSPVIPQFTTLARMTFKLHGVSAILQSFHKSNWL